MNNQKIKQLFDNLKNKLPELESVLKEVNDKWNHEDCVYRFYHGSFKVYRIQYETERIVDCLKSLLPETELNKNFLEIYNKGTGKVFDLSHNKDWNNHTRPLLEAFFHSRYFLEMAIKYSKELNEPPQVLPSGWAALLYLYNLR